MTGWHFGHLIVLSMWAGLVAAETVLEVAAYRDDRLAPTVARFHLALDLYVELPLLALVLATGAALALRTPIDAVLAVKLAAGLGAVAANLICVGLVFARRRLADQGAPPQALRRLSRRVFATALTGIPLALIALLIGGRRALWW